MKTDMSAHDDKSSALIPQLRWEADPRTAKAASEHPILTNGPAPQFVGCSTYGRTWDDRVIPPAVWPARLCSSPGQIVSFFQEGSFTQALAMVVSWGGMGRRSSDIYGPKTANGGRKNETIHRIDRTLRDSAESIQASRSIEEAWRMLIGMDGLHWSAVITSKTLHFLCRALGFEQNPPVPIDGAVIRNRLWPDFRKSITSDPPENWQGESFAAYSRYMTAILTWARQRDWTTTQMEATIFAHPYRFK